MANDVGFVKTHQDCPCGKHKGCYSVREDGSGFCFSCNTTKNQKTFWDELKECRPTPPGTPFNERAIPPLYAAKWGISALLDEAGNVKFYQYDLPNGLQKVRRVNPKEDRYVYPDGKKIPRVPIVGGHLWDKSQSTTAVIVEGELDAPSADFMLNDGMKTQHHVYYIPGAGIPNDAKQREQIYEELRGYDRIILAFEHDDAGKKAKETLATMFPKQVRISELGLHKDANDYLKAGDVKEFKRSVRNYSHYTPEYIYNGETALVKVWEDSEQEFFVPTPFEGLNKLIKGIPLGFMTLIVGAEGLGKSELLRSICWEVLKQAKDKYPVSLTMFEEANKDIIKGFCSYNEGWNFKDPDKVVTLADAKPTIEFLSDNFFITDFYKARDEMSVESFMAKIEYLHFICGVRYFFIDPINQLRSDVPGETVVHFLDSLAMNLSRFCVDNKCAVVYTAHANDDGDVRDSRMLAKQAGIRINVYRDINSDSEYERNKTFLEVKKNRPFSRLGKAGYLEFDFNSFTLRDPTPSSAAFLQEETPQPSTDHGALISHAFTPRKLEAATAKYRF